MAGVRRRGGKNMSLTPYCCYRYKYCDRKFIPIVREAQNTTRSSILRGSSMEGKDIG